MQQRGTSKKRNPVGRVAASSRDVRTLTVLRPSSTRRDGDRSRWIPWHPFFLRHSDLYTTYPVAGDAELISLCWPEATAEQKAVLAEELFCTLQCAKRSKTGLDILDRLLLEAPELFAEALTRHGQRFRRLQRAFSVAAGRGGVQPVRVPLDGAERRLVPARGARRRTGGGGSGKRPARAALRARPRLGERRWQALEPRRYPVAVAGRV